MSSSCGQVFIESNSGLAGSDLEREFFILRKLIEKEKVQRFAAEGVDSSDFYICTLSTKLIVYKVWQSPHCRNNILNQNHHVISLLDVAACANWQSSL